MLNPSCPAGPRDYHLTHLRGCLHSTMTGEHRNRWGGEQGGGEQGGGEQGGGEQGGGEQGGGEQGGGEQGGGEQGGDTLQAGNHGAQWGCLLPSYRPQCQDAAEGGERWGSCGVWVFWMEILGETLETFCCLQCPQ